MKNRKILYGYLLVGSLLCYHVAFYTIWIVYRAAKGEAPLSGFWIIVFPSYLAITAALFQISFSSRKDKGLVGLLIVCVTTNIVLFAAAYVDYGLLAPGGGITRRFSECLYFSIITFTSVGYGDFTPTPGARPIAAAEAITGYFFIGLLVAVIARYWSRP